MDEQFDFSVGDNILLCRRSVSDNLLLERPEQSKGCMQLGADLPLR